MPFEIMRPSPDCLVVMVIGTITREDYQDGLAHAHEAAKEHVKQLVVLAEDVDVDGVDVDLSVIDTFAPAWQRVKRVALVGDIAKFAPLAKMFGPPTNAKIKGYKSDKLDDAIAWVCAGPSDTDEPLPEQDADEPDA